MQIRNKKPFKLTYFKQLRANKPITQYLYMEQPFKPQKNINPLIY